MVIDVNRFVEVVRYSGVKGGSDGNVSLSQNVNKIDARLGVV